MAGWQRCLIIFEIGNPSSQISELKSDYIGIIYSFKLYCNTSQLGITKGKLNAIGHSFPYSSLYIR